MGSHQEIMLSNPTIVDHQESNGDMQKVGYIGVLEVFVHQARDIHNICIYHKQDVYAKIFLTSDPELTESTRTINGGGQNPVFNENLRINVRTGDGSLRCEIWMLSRVRNYLQDQLLGFALVPLCEILENRKLEKEFELSTSDLFHSLSGFVKLSITYNGRSPDVMEIPMPAICLCVQDQEESDQVSCELEKIEFPDPKLMNENEIMVSEYYSTCAEIESQNVASGQSQTTESDDALSSDSNDHFVSRFPKENLETPPTHDSNPPDEKKVTAVGVVEPLVQPANRLKVEPEPKVVQQEIVDMYMKSMKQFTEALAKMKLPMDNESDSPDSVVNHSTESNGKGSKVGGPNPRVFYGSRAFF